jgi:hypothetical protein
MIPKEAFLSIAAVMVLGWLFGIVCDRMFIRWAESHSEPPEYADHDRWEEDPEPTRRCDTCKHDGLTLYDEPCDSCCGFSRWEAETK